MKNPTTLPADDQTLRLPLSRDIDWPLFLISGGFLGAFLLAALIDIDVVSALVNTLFAWSTKAFGLYWQVLMLATFVVSLAIGFFKCGRVRLGGVTQRPDISTFNWIAVIMCALLAGGGAFWAAAEPLMHFASPPRCSQACSLTAKRRPPRPWRSRSYTGAFWPGRCSAACWRSC